MLPDGGGERRSTGGVEISLFCGRLLQRNERFAFQNWKLIEQFALPVHRGQMKGYLPASGSENTVDSSQMSVSCFFTAVPRQN